MNNESKPNSKEENYIEGRLAKRIRQINGERRSYHMPGHKNGSIKTFDNVWTLDVTEIEGTDDLFHDDDVIAKVHHKLSQVYCRDNHRTAGNGLETKLETECFKTRMLVGGSSAGIRAAMMAVIEPEEAFLVARNCHKSVYNGLLLGDVNGQYIYPEYSYDYHLFTELSPIRVEEAFKGNPKLKGLIMTSPTYEGIFSDIRSIAEIVHRYGGVLIVDEAHGAHLTFSDQLPVSALHLGADIVIQSTHKTLPALTQSGLVHYNTRRIDENRLLQGLAIHQTSSPSYVLMASIEGAVDYMWTHRKDYNQFVEKLIQLRQKHWKNFSLTSNSDLLVDPTRFTLYIRQPGISGTRLLSRLRAEYGLDFECAGLRTIVAIVTIADELDDIASMLDSVDHCLECMQRTEEIFQDRLSEESFPRTHEQAMSMKQAFYKKKTSVSLEDAVGCIAAESVIPYPPGIPVLVPGEKISAEHINFLQRLLSVNLEIYGIIKEEINVIKE